MLLTIFLIKLILIDIINWNYHRLFLHRMRLWWKKPQPEPDWSNAGCVLRKICWTILYLFHWGSLLCVLGCLYRDFKVKVFRSGVKSTFYFFSWVVALNWYCFLVFNYIQSLWDANCIKSLKVICCFVNVIDIFFFF